MSHRSSSSTIRKFKSATFSAAEVLECSEVTTSEVGHRGKTAADTTAGTTAPETIGATTATSSKIETTTDGIIIGAAIAMGMTTNVAMRRSKWARIGQLS